jgi:hypothetical protein
MDLMPKHDRIGWNAFLLEWTNSSAAGKVWIIARKLLFVLFLFLIIWGFRQLAT